MKAIILILCFIAALSIDIPFIPLATKGTKKQIVNELIKSLNSVKLNQKQYESFLYQCKKKNTNSNNPSLHHIIPKNSLSGLFFRTFEINLHFVSLESLNYIIESINDTMPFIP